MTDLGSTNGTSMAGRRLQPNVPTPLAPGDTVRLGDVELNLEAT